MYFPEFWYTLGAIHNRRRPFGGPWGGTKKPILADKGSQGGLEKIDVVFFAFYKVLNTTNETSMKQAFQNWF